MAKRIGWKKVSTGWMVDLDAGRERYYTGTKAGVILIISDRLLPDGPFANTNDNYINDGDRVLEAYNQYDLIKGIKHYRKGHIVE